MNCAISPSEASSRRARLLKVFSPWLERAAGAAGDAADASQGGAKSVGAHVLAYTEQNVNAAFDLANKLVRAKDPQEAFALQSEYLKAQFAALQTQAKELGGVLQKSVTPGSN